MFTQFRLFAWLLIALVMLPLLPAQAHNLNVFAMSNGDQITGYVYFTGGTRAKQAEVELRHGDSSSEGAQVLVSTKADDQGNFAFSVSHRADYTVFTDTGDGHVAKFKLYADDFAENLPIADVNAPITVKELHLAQTVSEPASDEPAATTYATKSVGLKSLSRDELTELINHAVARQVGPLREEVNSYRNDVRMSDVMGGIGVIIGIFGVSAWIVARRQVRNHSAKQS
ncbi:MAG: hypothetical protein ACMZ66_17630 [Thalassospira sp.]|uniref:hypothetical protein n=1 Tax=Thalassospira sp. TaxID=1912094 RepID=UPI003A88675B